MPLGRVADIFPGLAPRAALDDAPRQGVRIIGLADLADGQVQRAGTASAWAEVPPEALARHALQLGDVLLAARGSQPKAAWVSEADLPAVASANLLVVRARPGMRPGMLFAYLASEPGLAMARALSRSATDQLSIAARDLATLELPVPPRAAQDTIHDLIEASERAYSAALQAAAGRRAAARAIALDMLRQTAND
jgi:hypothetical protein